MRGLDERRRLRSGALPLIRDCVASCNGIDCSQDFLQAAKRRELMHGVGRCGRYGSSKRRIRITRTHNYNILRRLHPLQRVPLVGAAFVARLVIECMQ